MCEQWKIMLFYHKIDHYYNVKILNDTLGKWEKTNFNV
jgi:hypothetical protein